MSETSVKYIQRKYIDCHYFVRRLAARSRVGVESSLTDGEAGE
jgi:hypothetical protein